MRAVRGPAQLTRKSKFLVVGTALVVLAGTVVLADAEQSPATTADSAGAQPSTSETLQEVTVTAKHLKLDWSQRNELIQKAATFVFGIAAVSSYNEYPPRWFAPVCPLVTGLPREQGEFVLGRISEIARAAGAPLGGEHCHPNLFIYVTAQPKGLLRAMFGNATPLRVDEFIDTPRPVRVWHNIYEVPAGKMAIPGRINARAWAIGPVYVVVDRAHLHAVSQGQLADYVGMVGLAGIRFPPHLGDAQTILRLFDGIPPAAPEGLSDWDQAFLNMLYHPEPSLATPRSLMARRMVVELVPR